MSVDELKRAAAIKSVSHVADGMTVGLGSGTTAYFAIQELGRRLRQGQLRSVTGVATSQAAADQAARLGIPLVRPGPTPVDVAIDGMDELDANLDAIKGLGGALTREKIVEARARHLILIGDDSKRVTRLGQRTPVPVEVVPFGIAAVQADLEDLGCKPTVRQAQGEQLFVTDNGNLIIDCHFAEPFNPIAVAESINRLAGVVEHGLFLGLAHRAYLAGDAGLVELTR